MFNWVRKLASKAGNTIRKLATRLPWESDPFYQDEFLDNMAENLSAVFRAKNLVSGASSSLPIRFFKWAGRKKDEKQYLENLSIDNLLNAAPNPYMDSMTVRGLITDDLILDGNGYAEKVYDGDELIALWPLRPERVRPFFDNRFLRYKVRDERGNERVLPAESIFHINVYSKDGITGNPVITYARQSFELTWQLETFGTNLFKRGIRPSGFLKYPGELHEETEKKLRRQFERLYAGKNNAFRLMILEEGMDFQIANITPENAQFLMSRKFQIYEIARWFGVPPHLLFELERSTNNNIEQQSLEFLAYCLSFWLQKWCSAIKRQLLSPFENIWVEFDTDALVQIDINTKASATKTLKDGGIITSNEGRASFGYRSIGEAGDILLYPTNFANAESFLEPEEEEPSPVPVPAPVPVPDSEGNSDPDQDPDSDSEANNDTDSPQPNMSGLHGTGNRHARRMPKMPEERNLHSANGNH